MGLREGCWGREGCCGVKGRVFGGLREGCLGLGK